MFHSFNRFRTKKTCFIVFRVCFILVIWFVLIIQFGMDGSLVLSLTICVIIWYRRILSAGCRVPSTYWLSLNVCIHFDRYYSIGSVRIQASRFKIQCDNHLMCSIFHTLYTVHCILCTLVFMLQTSMRVETGQFIWILDNSCQQGPTISMCLVRCQTRIKRHIWIQTDDYRISH